MRSRRHQCIADKPSRHRTQTNLDARAVDTLLLHEVLPSIECALCAGLRMLVRRRVSNHNELRPRLLLHGECDVVQAALRLVVYAHRPAVVTLKADVAEVLRLRNDRRRGNGQRDLGVRLRCLAKVVDHVASDGDRGRGESRG